MDSEDTKINVMAYELVLYVDEEERPSTEIRKIVSRYSNTLPTQDRTTFQRTMKEIEAAILKKMIMKTLSGNNSTKERELQLGLQQIAYEQFANAFKEYRRNHNFDRNALAYSRRYYRRSFIKAIKRIQRYV